MNEKQHYQIIQRRAIKLQSHQKNNLKWKPIMKIQISNLIVAGVFEFNLKITSKTSEYIKIRKIKKLTRKLRKLNEELSDLSKRRKSIEKRKKSIKNIRTY